MTAAIYIKGFLQHDYGVDLTQVRWVQGAMNEARSHGDPTRAAAEEDVDREQNDRHKALGQLLAAGEIDATPTR